jgi:maltooligosyltrehalose trehalohydrolase
MWTDTPYFGAVSDEAGVHFRLLAGGSDERPPDVELILHSGAASGSYAVRPVRPGVLETRVSDARPGDRYSYRVNGGETRPDPASRYQPEGVHGPSEVIDPTRFGWRDGGWHGVRPASLVLYELHVGTFTSEGTFAAATQHLRDLKDLGVTMVELMPVADFPGGRNWGYDGVSLFAPARAYGRPDDFRAFVNMAHEVGLGVMLDVVYNHLGPEGAYLPEFYAKYLTSTHSTPWGDAVNLDGPGSDVVRTFIMDNALHWVREYHLDGLRFDATHALIDESPVHVLAEIAERLRSSASWPLTLHAEDHRNLSTIVEPRAAGGWGFDGVWADDFHHSIRRLVAGDSYSYYEDFEGTAEELASTIRQGWLYTGQPSKHMKKPRGTDPSQVPMRSSVVCVQNHDQIGNRACGDRLHQGIDAARWRAISVLLLTSPSTPLLFMGQEWAASTPFLYFTDLGEELGRAVTEGRRREFKDFPEFARGGTSRIPDPQAACTFERSQLRWDERTSEPHAPHLALYRELLRLRTSHAALHASDCSAADASAEGEDAIVMRRAGEGETLLIVSRLRGAGDVSLATYVRSSTRVETLLATEDPSFSRDPMPATVGGRHVRFERPGAVILRATS